MPEYRCRTCNEAFSLPYKHGLAYCSRECMDAYLGEQEEPLSAQIERYNNRDMKRMEELRKQIVVHLPPIEEFLK